MEKQKGFFDEDFRLSELEEHGDPLIKLNELIPWERFRPLLKKVFYKEPKNPGGRPPYDYVMMFKILVLQRLYNLSDSQMQFQIMDRLSFMRFLGLNLNDRVPDEKTIWHFREVLVKSGKMDILFEEFRSFLLDKGVIAESGSIVDARWMTKSGVKHYGYKNHIKVDKKSKLVHRYVVTPASTHDSQALEELLTVSDAHHELYADSAYSGGPIENILKENNIRNRIHEKGYRGYPLTEKQKARNKIKSKTRVRVEHVFGCIVNSFKGNFIRTIGIERAGTVIGMTNLTYNMVRYTQLCRA